VECGHDGHSPDVTVEFDGNSWEFSTTVEKLVEKPRNHHDWREKPQVFRGIYTGEGRVTAIKRASSAGPFQQSHDSPRTAWGESRKHPVLTRF
jgi:hypothetical protein